MAEDFQDLIVRIREAAHRRILYLPHAVNQMNAPERMITPGEVRAVIFRGEVIEDYPEDAQGHSYLLLGFGDQRRPMHVVCAPKPDYLAVITAYLPSPTQWQTDWRTRKAR